MVSGSLKNPAPHGFRFVGGVDIPCRANISVRLDELGALAGFEVAFQFCQIWHFLALLCGFLGEVIEVHSDQAVIAGVVVALDIDPLRRVSAFDITLTAPECALSLLNAQVPAGYSRAITLTLRQGSGANKVQWPSNVVWAYNRQPVLSYVPGAYDLVTLVYDPIAHNWRGMVDGGWFNV